MCRSLPTVLAPVRDRHQWRSCNSSCEYSCPRSVGHPERGDNGTYVAGPKKVRKKFINLPAENLRESNWRYICISLTDAALECVVFTRFAERIAGFWKLFTGLGLQLVSDGRVLWVCASTLCGFLVRAAPLGVDSKKGCKARVDSCEDRYHHKQRACE
jgi:hypothetical protein